MNSRRSFRPRLCLFCGAAFLFIGLFLFPSPAAAFCPRIKIHVNNEFFKSRFVVIGQVLSERTELDGDGFLVLTDYQVKVLRTYRGSHRQSLQIRSENDTGRFPMQKGQKYLLFVRTFEGHLYIDNCGNSELLSDAEDAVDAIKQISKAGPYGEIEARVSSVVDNVAGIRFIAHRGNMTFPGVTDKGGWLRLRVPPGVYKLTARSPKFLLTSYDLNEDQPDRLVVHKGSSVQLDYNVELR
jgi:hypothetical protein